MKALEKSFFKNTNVVEVARYLIGCELTTVVDGIKTGGIITETEAYDQREQACHAFGGKRTKRTEIMFGEGGTVYVYLCYGLHNMFNIVTGVKGYAQAVLIRAIEPSIGLEIIKKRRITGHFSALTNGPGKVAQALKIDLTDYGSELNKDKIFIAEKNTSQRFDIVESKRIGVGFAKKDALLPWRFFIAPN